MTSMETTTTTVNLGKQIKVFLLNYCRLWAFFGFLFLMMALFMLAPSTTQAQVASSLLTYSIMVGCFGTFAVLLFCFAPLFRVSPLARNPQPSPFVVAVACALVMVVQLVCAKLVVFPRGVDWHSFMASVLFTLFVFCIHMAVLPSFDYGVVHCSLGTSCTVLFHLLHNDHYALLWFSLAAFSMGCFLTFYYWLRDSPRKMVDF